MECMVNPEQLLGLLRQQRDLYHRLADLSARQRGMISGDRPEALLNILTERQELIIALARLNELLSPLRQDWNNTFAALPPSIQQSATDLLDEVNATLRSIIQADQEDGALLSARKQALVRNLADVEGTRAAGAAYARQARSERIGDPGVTA